MRIGRRIIRWLLVTGTVLLALSGLMYWSAKGATRAMFREHGVMSVLVDTLHSAVAPLERSAGDMPHADSVARKPGVGANHDSGSRH
jgi:hypothetical protein